MTLEIVCGKADIVVDTFKGYDLRANLEDVELGFLSQIDIDKIIREVRYSNEILDIVQAIGVEEILEELDNNFDLYD